MKEATALQGVVDLGRKRLQAAQASSSSRVAEWLEGDLMA